jgi:hypothetical protein
MKRASLDRTPNVGALSFPSINRDHALMVTAGAREPQRAPRITVYHAAIDIQLIGTNGDGEGACLKYRKS